MFLSYTRIALVPHTAAVWRRHREELHKPTHEELPTKSCTRRNPTKSCTRRNPTNDPTVRILNKTRSDPGGRREVPLRLHKDPNFATLYLPEFLTDSVIQGLILQLLKRAFHCATYFEFPSSGSKVTAVRVQGILLSPQGFQQRSYISPPQ